MGNMLYLAVDENKLKRRTKFVCKSLGATLTKWPFGASVRSYPSLSRTFKRIEWPCDRCQPVTYIEGIFCLLLYSLKVSF